MMMANRRLAADVETLFRIADGELAQLGVEVEGAEKQGLVIPVDRVPRCGEAHGGDGLRDGVVEERRKRREPVRPEVAAGGVRRAVRPDRFRPRLHALERGTRPRIDAEPVEKVDVPAQFATRATRRNSSRGQATRSAVPWRLSRARRKPA